MNHIDLENLRSSLIVNIGIKNNKHSHVGGPCLNSLLSLLTKIIRIIHQFFVIFITEQVFHHDLKLYYNGLSVLLLCLLTEPTPLLL